MDLARNIAILMVICMHVTAAWKYGDVDTFKWHASELWDVICRSAVPIFFMISGAFYKEAPINKTVNKLVRFIAIFFEISLLYTLSDACWMLISGGYIQGNQILNGILNYKYHLWYLPEYIFVLSIAPILVKAIDEDKGKLTEYLLGIWILFGILINTILTATSGFEICELFNRYLNFLSSLVFLSKNHVGYFILGRYLSQKGTTKKIRNVLYTLGVIATIALYILTDRYSHYLGYADNRWLSTLNIFVLFQASSMFIFFWNFKISDKWTWIATFLSKYTFGIYLIHVFFLDWSYNLNIFTENGIWKYEINPLLNTPLRVILIYGVSFICTFAIKKISIFLKTQLNKQGVIG